MKLYRSKSTGTKFYASTAADVDSDFLGYAENFGIDVAKVARYYTDTMEWSEPVPYFMRGSSILCTKDSFLILPADRLIREIYGPGAFMIEFPDQFTALYERVEYSAPTESQQKKVLNGFSFFLDAGHGGTDPGAVNDNLGLQEKIAALDICLALGEKLEALGAGIYYSRIHNSSRPALSTRAAQANSLNCTAFISIHLNSAANKTATGAETLVYNLKGTGYKLAGHIQEQLIKATGFRDRGIKDRPDLTVLKKTAMPAVLVECGFISNDEEAQKLFEKAFQDKIAAAIAAGVVETFGN